MKMNNLIKKSDLTNLSPVARDVYTASNKPMIKSYEDLNIVVNAIHVSITQVIADKGVRLETEDINYLKQNICRDIIHDFNTLSLEDVNVCFRMGVRGKLGEYYGINVATLYQWLEKYKNESEHLRDTLNECISQTANYYVSETGKVLHMDPQCVSLNRTTYEMVLMTKEIVYYPKFFCKRCTIINYH